MKQKSEKQLWDLFSKYIRARDANYQGYCQCISCSAIKNWKEMDAGHYIAVGSDRALKYNEINVNAQCSACNNYKHGNLINYRQGLVNKYGRVVTDQLEHSHYHKVTKKKLNQLEINSLYAFYKQLLDSLKTKKCL